MHDFIAKLKNNGFYTLKWVNFIKLKKKKDVSRQGFHGKVGDPCFLDQESGDLGAHSALPRGFPRSLRFSVPVCVTHTHPSAQLPRAHGVPGPVPDPSHAASHGVSRDPMGATVSWPARRKSREVKRLAHSSPAGDTCMGRTPGALSPQAAPGSSGTRVPSLA